MWQKKIFYFFRGLLDLCFFEGGGKKHPAGGSEGTKGNGCEYGHQ